MIVLTLVSVASDMINLFIRFDHSPEIVVRIYSFFEFELTSLFFFSLAKRQWYKQLIVILMIIFPVVVVLDALRSENRVVYDNLVMLCESVVFVSFSVAAFYRMMADMQYSSITVTPKFWMTSAVLFYFATAIFMFISVNYVSGISQEQFEIVWGLHAVLRIVYITLLTTALWKVRKQYQ